MGLWGGGAGRAAADVHLRRNLWLVLFGADVGWVFLAVILVGGGQSMSISAQSALVSEHCETEIARLGDGVVYGVYRLLERIGNAAGPLIAAALVLGFGYQTSFVAIGSAVSSGCFRLVNPEVMDLYERIPVGTKVIVLPMDRRADLGSVVR